MKTSKPRMLPPKQSPKKRKEGSTQTFLFHFLICLETEVFPESELESFFETLSHCLAVKMNKHWPSPGVIIIFLPSSFRNFTGKEIRFFSIVQFEAYWRYIPQNVSSRILFLITTYFESYTFIPPMSFIEE